MVETSETNAFLLFYFELILISANSFVTETCHSTVDLIASTVLLMNDCIINI